VPAGAFPTGTFDPDPSAWLTLALDREVAPSLLGEQPGAGPLGDVTDDWLTWVWDRDGDGQGTNTRETFSACPMHAPISFEGVNAPYLQGQLDVLLSTDCNDLDAAIFAGAPDPVGDGIDQDCDGADGPNGRTAPSEFGTAAAGANLGSASMQLRVTVGEPVPAVEVRGSTYRARVGVGTTQIPLGAR
jgi:hypothetical protein